MSDYNYEECLRAIKEDDYAGFKDGFQNGVDGEQSQVLLKYAVVNHRKFIAEYLIKNIEIPADLKNECLTMASTAEDLAIFRLLAEGGEIPSQAWMNLFNVQPEEKIKEVIDGFGLPAEHQLIILQYSTSNPDKKVHDLAFEKIYTPELIADEESRQNLIDSICFSGNTELLSKLPDTSALKAAVETEQDRHIDFAGKLDEYIDFIFNNTPKEKVAMTVNNLGLMDEIRSNPNVEEWDLIIQDYLVNEEYSLAEDREGELSENCRAMLELVKSSKIILLEISQMKPSEYKIYGKDILSNRSIVLPLDRRIMDVRCLYACYTTEFEGVEYIISHPLVILPDRKSLIQLGLRKEKERKQQKISKKSKGKKKAAARVKLSDSEVFRFLLSEHLRSLKEVGDIV